MSWKTSRAGLFLRDIGRTIGLNRIVGRLLSRGYEEAYEERLLNSIRQGDIVWDIGANVGLYTKKFADKVGVNGVVVGFEPSTKNYSRLQVACEGCPQVRLQPFGLGAQKGVLQFLQGEDELGATSRVCPVDIASDRLETVEIRVGDELISGGEVPAPNVIKLDVEGFEGEVLEGLVKCIESPALRLLGIEVHFGILSQRGLRDAPRVIESRLKAAKFEVSWPDSSHLIASR